MENPVHSSSQTPHSGSIPDAFHGQLKLQSFPTWLHVLFHHLRGQSLNLRENVDFVADVCGLLHNGLVLVVLSLRNNAYLQQDH